jgi:hypothetical protein
MNDFESICIGDAYEPQPKQAEFHNSPARYPLAEGGRGGVEIIIKSKALG